jgi:hypothetical protein
MAEKIFKFNPWEVTFECAVCGREITASWGDLFQPTCCGIQYAVEIVAHMQRVNCKEVETKE